MKVQADIQIILGGIHTTSLPIHSLQYTMAVFVLIGEGRITLVKFAKEDK